MASAQDTFAARDSALPVHSSAASAVTVSSHNTFAALDASPTSSPAVLSPTWVHASAQRAEAGFEDPALGWVAVRAGADGGGVHASLIPGSAEAATALSGHLAGLNAYLSQQHTGLSSVTLGAPESHAGLASGAGSNTGQSFNQNPNHASSQQGSEDRSYPGTEAAIPVLSRPTSATAANPQPSADFTPLPRPGARISVMA